MSRARVCAPHQLTEADVALWHQWQDQDARQANPFLSPEAVQVVGRHRSDVRVAVLEDDTRTVGFLAHHRSALGVGRGLLYGRGNGHGLVTAPGFDWDGEKILEHCGLKVWEYDYLPAHQADRLQPRGASSSCTYVVDLSSTWDEWLHAKRAASSTVRKALQNQRKLRREVGDVSFTFHDPSPEVLGLLIRWKSEQFRRTGRRDLDHFSLRWFTDVVAELTATSTPQFSGALSVLRVDGRPVAAQQALCGHGVLSCWYTAYDTELSAYSPGLVCQLELVRAAFERGLREVDLAKGHADYKAVLADGERPLVEGWIERASPAAAIRRVQQWPRRHAYEFVRAHPRLKQLGIGALRSLEIAGRPLSRS